MHRILNLRRGSPVGCLVLLLLTGAIGAQPSINYQIDTFAGTLERGDGGPAVEAQLNRVPPPRRKRLLPTYPRPEGVAIDGAGNLYIADTSNRCRSSTR